MRRGLYAITDGAPHGFDRLLAQVDAILAAGCAVLQYRDKGGDPVRRRQEAAALLACCRRYATPLIINDDLELAVAVGADGVHLGQSDGSIAAARTRLGAHALIGATCHDRLALAEAAVAAGADYVAFGRFHPSSSKPHAVHASPGLLQQARALGVPLVAIGGITPDNGGPLLAAGADLLAVIDALFGADDPAAAAQRFNTLFAQEPET